MQVPTEMRAIARPAPSSFPVATDFTRARPRACRQRYVGRSEIRWLGPRDQGLCKPVEGEPGPTSLNFLAIATASSWLWAPSLRSTLFT